jgi:hypothetical protein
MKLLKTVFIFAVMTIFTGIGEAQDLGKTDAAVKAQLNTVLTSYYALKDTLVDSDSEKASVAAADLLAALEKVDVEKMTPAQKEFWGKLETPIKTDSTHMKNNKDLEHQRGHFAKLSNNVHSLIFNFKANSAEAYLHYCPMKKATWLSASKEVKNPFYGSKMLDCGSVRSTLKKN